MPLCNLIHPLISRLSVAGIRSVRFVLCKTASGHERPVLGSSSMSAPFRLR